MFNFLRLIPNLCKVKQEDITCRKISEATQILKEKGIVLIPRELFFQNEKKINELQGNLETYKSIFIKNNFPKNLKINLHDSSSLNTHPAILARKGDSFIYKRKGTFFDIYKKKWRNIDKNLFDYYNPDKNLLEKFGLNEYLSKVKEVSQNIISSLFKKQDIDNPYTNLYIYKNVKDPRCLHVDTHKIMYKVFTSLTDVTTLDDGPISYVPGSNKLRGKLRSILSKILSSYIYSDIGNQKNDAVLFGIQESLAIKTRFLDVLIGNQSCVHGDLPAMKNNTKLQKIIYVHNFFTKSKI